MTISNDGQWAYLLQERSGYVSRMNLQTGQIGPRVMVGSRPNYVAYLDQQKLLAVSLTLYQKILLLNPESLRTVSTLSTGSRPEGILVSDNQLYIAERDADTVSKNDLSNRSVQSRFQVGMGPRRLADGGDQIFISNYSSGSISAILPDQFGAVQEIFGLGLPLEMVFDPFYRRLYVADEQDNALVVIDANTNQLVGHISLGAKPVGLVNIK
jgi:YVTN family beta-propeller protein